MWNKANGASDGTGETSVIFSVKRVTARNILWVAVPAKGAAPLDTGNSTDTSALDKGDTYESLHVAEKEPIENIDNNNVGDKEVPNKEKAEVKEKQVQTESEETCFWKVV